MRELQRVLICGQGLWLGPVILVGRAGACLR